MDENKRLLTSLKRQLLTVPVNVPIQNFPWEPAVLVCLPAVPEESPQGTGIK